MGLAMTWATSAMWSRPPFWWLSPPSLTLIARGWSAPLYRSLSNTATWLWLAEVNGARAAQPGGLSRNASTTAANSGELKML